jgi:hypothetical protein
MRAQIETERRTAKELKKQDKSTIIVQNSGPKQKPIKVPKAKKASIGQKRSVQFANILARSAQNMRKVEAYRLERLY